MYALTQDGADSPVSVLSDISDPMEGLPSLQVRKMTTQEAPKIEFPCAYPLKIVGRAGHDFQQLVLDVIEVHAPGFDQTSVSLQESSGGKFQSVRVTITATGEPQLKSIFEDLKATGRVQMVI